MSPVLLHPHHKKMRNNTKSLGCEHLHLAVRVQEDVRGLDVAMEHLAGV